MTTRPINAKFLLGLGLVFLLCGCSAKVQTVVWMDHKTLFSDYKLFEIRQVFNETNRPVDPSVLDLLNTQIRQQFESKGLPIDVPPEVTTGVLVVSSDLLVYDSYTPMHTHYSGRAGEGETKCILRTRLVDKASQLVVAEVVAIKVAGAGGVYPIPYGYPNVNMRAHERLLKDVAFETVEEVSKLLPTAGL